MGFLLGFERFGDGAVDRVGLDAEQLRFLVHADQAGPDLDQVQLLELVHLAAVALTPTALNDVVGETELADAPGLEQPVDLGRFWVRFLLLGRNLTDNLQTAFGFHGLDGGADMGEGVLPIVGPDHGDLCATVLPRLEGLRESAGHDDVAVGVRVTEHGHEGLELALAESGVGGGCLCFEGCKPSHLSVLSVGQHARAVRCLRSLA